MDNQQRGDFQMRQQHRNRLLRFQIFGVNVSELQQIFVWIFALLTYTPLSLWLAFAFLIGGLATCIPAMLCMIGLLMCATASVGISVFLVFIGMILFLPLTIVALIVSFWIVLLYSGYKILATNFSKHTS
ncbi:12437_t:CDS:2 [Ambispora leptoticha]|uniref:12437_t:CDS:1 n=1 Tax=Ambispora leptoticha TaxID=144679 RepID=A0A9N8WK57_9GLOM|nr:12437_t:CDS:2 [Ambispora leptoticha]